MGTNEQGKIMFWKSLNPIMATTGYDYGVTFHLLCIPGNLILDNP